MNLWRKIKYQTSCCIRGLFSFPPNIPGEKRTLLIGKNIKELQMQRKEISVASEADKKQSWEKRTNHRAALKFEKCAVSSCVLLGLLQFSLRSKPTNQVAAFERCWSTALLRGYHVSPSSVWIGRVPYSGQRTKFFFLNGPTYAGKIYVSIYFFLITTDRP